MRALFLITLVLSSASFAGGRFDRVNSRCAQGRSSRGLACASGVALADAPQAGDLAGAWWAMYGDGTMRSGSAVTLVPTGAPTNTVENGWPVRTYTAAQNDQEPANVAFPASDFSVCYHRRSVALPNVQIMAFGTSGAAAGFSSLPFEQQVSGNLISWSSDGVAATQYTSSTAPLPLVAGTWAILCHTFQRVGGANNNVGTTYVNGVAVNTSSAQRLAQALSSVWSTNGYAAASAAGAGSTRGVFVTYKLLSPADIARISAATAP
jgi:Concanavalin A-like lectin/glucanases superfamily